MTIADFFFRRRPESPGQGSRAVTPSDTADLDPPAMSLYVTTAGDVCFVGADGQEDTWAVPANFIIPVAVKQVKATGTTGGAGATGIKAIV
jgi:hypothetical protein